MTDNPNIVPLPLALEPVRERYCDLVDAAVAWHRSGGTASAVADPDLFTLICAAADDASDPASTPTVFTRMSVYHLLRCDIPNWCAGNRCLWTEDTPQAVWAWLDWLDAEHRFDSGSDPLAELRKPLRCYGWLDADGRPLPVDAPREIECECHIPYRETAQLLNRITVAAEWSGGKEPVELLRGLADGSLYVRDWADVVREWSDVDPDDGVAPDDGRFAP